MREKKESKFLLFFFSRVQRLSINLRVYVCKRTFYVFYCDKLLRLCMVEFFIVIMWNLKNHSFVCHIDNTWLVVHVNKSFNYYFILSIYFLNLLITWGTVILLPIVYRLFQQRRVLLAFSIFHPLYIPFKSSIDVTTIFWETIHRHFVNPREKQYFVKANTPLDNSLSSRKINTSFTNIFESDYEFFSFLPIHTL